MADLRSFRFELGTFECAVFNDFTNPQTLNQLVTGVPEGEVREAFQRLGLPSDPALLDTNVMLVSLGGTRMLIDSGWGPEGSLLSLLRAEGMSTSEIDLVILTHTDGDHVGGLLDSEGALTFSNAEYVMTRSAWDRWTSDYYIRQLGKERAEWVQNAAAAIEAHTTMLEAGDEIVPNIRLVDAPGHREGHVAVAISSAHEQWLNVADAVLHPIFILNPDWQSPIDSHPNQAAETRRLLLNRATEDGVILASAHLPFPGMGHVEAREGAWVFRPLQDEDEVY